MRFANPSKKTRVIATTKGHSIEFPGRGSVTKAEAFQHPKDPTLSTLVTDEGHVYVHVPHIVQNEVLMAGLLPETEIEEEVESDVPVKPEDPAKLKDELFRVFDRLTANAEREDFAGTGVPKDTAVSRETGYPVTKAEIKELWTTYMQEGGAQRD